MMVIIGIICVVVGILMFVLPLIFKPKSFNEIFKRKYNDEYKHLTNVDDRLDEFGITLHEARNKSFWFKGKNKGTITYYQPEPEMTFFIVCGLLLAFVGSSLFLISAGHIVMALYVLVLIAAAFVAELKRLIKAKKEGKNND